MELSLKPSSDYRYENLNSTDISKTGERHYQNTNFVLHPSLEIEPQVFQPLTKAQMRSALNYFDVLKRFEDVIEKSGQEIKQRWQSTTKFNRQDEFIDEIAKKLHFTDRQLDFIFEAGITL